MKLWKLGSAALLAICVTASTASAQTVRMMTTLNSGEETPALLSGAVGTADVTVDVGNKELTVTLTVHNLPTNSVAGHIHVGPKGVAGPVVLDFPNIPGRIGDFSTTFRLGQGQMRAQPGIGINTIDDIIQAVVGGNAYVNIHTSANPGGEIRGQLAVVH